MGLPVVVFRLFNTVGPRQTGQYGMVVPRFAQQALRGQPLTVYGDGQQTRCFCDVADVVRALIALSRSQSAIGEVFNVGATTEITIAELAHSVLDTVDALGLRPTTVGADDERVVFIPYEEAYEAGFEDMRRRVPDTRKIRAAVEWEPQLSLDDTLRRVVTYCAQTDGASAAR
jgi:UDP-glucose 4-epimerase